jgi:hypothetical protein
LLACRLLPVFHPLLACRLLPVFHPLLACRLLPVCRPLLAFHPLLACRRPGDSSDLRRLRLARLHRCLRRELVAGC